MYRFMLFCTTLLAFVAALGFAPNADATITALCVGCTASSQFESAAWQAFSGYTQGINEQFEQPNLTLHGCPDEHCSPARRRALGRK